MQGRHIPTCSSLISGLTKAQICENFPTISDIKFPDTGNDCVVISEGVLLHDA